jgi:hypothetical protein
MNFFKIVRSLFVVVRVKWRAMQIGFQDCPENNQHLQEFCRNCCSLEMAIQVVVDLRIDSVVLGVIDE